MTLFLLILFVFCVNAKITTDIIVLNKKTSVSCSTSDILKGTWKNQLGFRMVIENVYNDTANRFNNYFTGSYYSARGNAKGYYPLHGAFNYNNCSTSIGFTVVFSNDEIDSGSNTAWSGQLRCSGMGLVIDTTWILNRYTENIDSWASTLIGKDLFIKQGENASCHFSNIEKRYSLENDIVIRNNV